MSGINQVVVLDDEAQPAPDTGLVVEGDVERDTLPEGLLADGEGYRLALRRPVVVKFKGATGDVREERFTDLPLRRLTGGDLRAMMVSDRKDGALLLLELATILTPASRVKAVIDRLDAPDLRRAMVVVAFLSGISPQTGP